MALTKITPQMFDTSAAGHDFNIDNGTFVVDASANRVGIGTATPSSLLHIASTGATSIQLEDTDNGFAATELNIENGGRDFKITTPQDTIFVQGSTESMRILTSGNVGIGTDTPARRLSVKKDTTITAGFNDITEFLDTTIGAGGSVSLNVGRANSTKNLGKMAFKYAGSGSNSNALNFGFYDADNLMTLLANGNVGIGITNPLNPLHVKQAQGSHLFALETSYAADRTGRGQISWRDSANITGGIWTEYDGTNVSMRFGNLYSSGYNTNTSMIIRGNGNVGIGTSSPDRNLHIETAGDSYLRVSGNRGNANDLHVGNIEFENTFGSAGVIAEMRAITGNSGTQSTKGQLAFYTDDGSTYAERMRIDASGDVGINGAPNLSGDYGQLSVHGRTGDSIATLNLNGNRTTNSVTNAINFYQAGTLAAEIKSTKEASNFNLATLSFHTQNNVRMRIKDGGGIQTPGNHQYNFRANSPNSPSAGNRIVFSSVVSGNSAGPYSTSTGIYTAAIDAWYLVSVGIRVDAFTFNSDTDYMRFPMWATISGTVYYPHTGGWIDPIKSGADFDANGNYQHFAYTVPIYLNANDTVQIRNTSNSGVSASLNAAESHFGILIMG